MRRAKLQSNHHQPTNTQTFLQAGRMTVKISDTAAIANFHHLNQSSEGLRERIEYIPQL